MSRLPDLARAAGMAYRMLLRANVTELPVDPLALLRRCRDTQVCTYAEAADMLGVPERAFEQQFGTAEAFTLQQEVGGKRQYLVIYQVGGHPARRRFTLAHELGHRALGHMGLDLAEEREADCFASHLLCPRPAIARLAERFLPLYAEQVAAVCYVSLSCARTLTAVPRAVSTDLLDEVGELFTGAVEGAKPVAVQGCRHRVQIKPER